MYQRRDSFFVSLNTALYFLTNVEMDLEKSAAVVDGDKINSGITSHAQELGIQVEKVRDVKGADLVLELADAEAVEIPEHMNKRILRKIDWHVMPWICGLYVLQYIDKGVLSYARVMGIMKDADIDSTQFS